jgi:hypothetical protein
LSTQFICKKCHPVIFPFVFPFVVGITTTLFRANNHNKKENHVRLTMASSLSPNHSSPELQALKKDDFAILSILSSKKRLMTNEKNAQLLKKFTATTTDNYVGANQEFCNLLSKEVKLSGRSASSQRSKWTQIWWEYARVLEVLQS